MATQANPWEIDWSQQAGAPPPVIAERRGRPNLPTPQNPTQEHSTVVSTERTQQQIQQDNTRGANFQDENALRQQYRQNPAVQAYESILPIYNAAQNAADNTAGDLQLVYAFSKIMDPGSVVRESEQASVAAAGSLSQRAQGYVDYISGHGRLTPEMRQQLTTEMAQRGSNLNRDYIRIRNDMVRDAERYGFDPHAIVGQHAALPYRERMGLDRHDVQMSPTARADHSGEDMRFWDEGRRPAEYSPRDPTAAITAAQGQAQQMFDQGATRAQLDRFAGSHGFTFGSDLDNAIRFRDRGGHGARIMAPQQAPERDPNEAPDGRGGRPTLSLDLGMFGQDLVHLDTEQAAANVRGAADTVTVGLATPAMAGLDTLVNGGSYGENLYREQGVDRYDEDNHTIARTVGQLSGGLLIPTGAVAEARTAAVAALRSGLTRTEAVAAARVAAARRLAIEGGAYSAVHGAASTDADASASERIAAFTVDGILGMAAGGAMGRFGTGFGRTAARASREPLVDPATGRLNAPLESASPGERVAAAADHGINLPLGAATDRGGAIIEKGLDVSPVSAGLMNDARLAATAETEQAVENVATRYGGARTMDEAGTALQAGARNWISRFDRVVGRVYDAIPILPTRAAVLDNTRTALRRLTDIFQSNPDLEEAFSNNKLDTYLRAVTGRVENVDTGLVDASGRQIARQEQRGGSLSWQDLKDFRSRIGYEIGEQRFSDSPQRDELRSLYAALSEDMRATAEAQGPGALRLFERANNLYREGQERIDGALVRILGDDSKNSPEAAAAALQTISQSGRGSANLAQLRAIRASLRKGSEWDDVASTLIRLGGQPAKAEGRAFNPQTFVDWYSGMTEPARDLLFAGGRRQELRDALDSFVAVTQRLAGTNALRNTSNTTPGMIGAATVGSVGTAIWAGLMNPLTAAKVAVGVGANYGIARLWTHAPFVRWATGYTRTMTSGPSAAAIRGRRASLMRLARETPAIADDIAEMDHRLFGGGSDEPGSAEQPQQ